MDTITITTGPDEHYALRALAQARCAESENASDADLRLLEVLRAGAPSDGYRTAPALSLDVTDAHELDRALIDHRDLRALRARLQAALSAASAAKLRLAA